MRDERDKKGFSTELFESDHKPARAPLNIHVPEISVYDEQPPVMYKKNPFPSQKAITVFGYSPSNLDSVLQRFKEHGEIKEINHGKNWMDIEYKSEKSIYLALKDTGTILNGEMVGVLQKNKKEIGFTHWNDKEQVFVKREEGVVTKILAYLFG